MLKIAICDDNEIQLTIIQEELEKNIKEKTSYTIDKFNSDAAFSRILQSGNCPYDIIFMDIVLGDSSASGIDLVHKVNFLNPSCQIIYISHVGFPAEREAEIPFIVERQPRADPCDARALEQVDGDRVSEFVGVSEVVVSGPDALIGAAVNLVGD